MHKSITTCRNANYNSPFLQKLFAPLLKSTRSDLCIQLLARPWIPDNATKGSLAMSFGQSKDSTVNDADGEPKEYPNAGLSERCKTRFEPLEPIQGGSAHTPPEVLPPPDFDSTSYPKGWLLGKRCKLVNVDVVESMRRIAVQEMNRKDWEINGLNEQLEADARCLAYLQLQLQQERSKRAEVERERELGAPRPNGHTNEHARGDTRNGYEDEEGPRDS